MSAGVRLLKEHRALGAKNHKSQDKISKNQQSRRRRYRDWITMMISKERRGQAEYNTARRAGGIHSSACTDTGNFSEVQFTENLYQGTGVVLLTTV